MSTISHMSRRRGVLHSGVNLDSYYDEVMSDTPSGFYFLDDASGTQATDYSSNSYHGTYVNTPTLAQPSIIPTEAVRTSTLFNDPTVNDEHVVIGGYNVDEITVEGITEFSGIGDGQGYIFSRSLGGTDWTILFWIIESPRRMGAGWRTTGSGSVWSGDFLTGSSEIDDDTPFHWAITYEEDVGGKVYINGSQVVSSAATGTLSNSTADWMISSIQAAGSKNIAGYTQGVAIWNYSALDVNTINRHARAAGLA